MPFNSSASGRAVLVFEWIIGLLAGAVLLAALARRVGAPYPTFLAVGGGCVAFLPTAPQWVLEPDLALALFVAPVLLDAAFDTSIRDLRANWLPITGLVIVAVGLTTAGVAVLVRWLLPDMPLAVAVALGAIVAPPDAAAAMAIVRHVGLPFRITKILEGESLLNDASALLIYRMAVATVVAGDLDGWTLAPVYGLSLLASLVAGPVLGWLVHRLVQSFSDAPSAIILQFCGTFGVWILAERLGLSGILTIVTYALTLSRLSPAKTPARLRVRAYAVWDTMVFLLNALAFLLIGLQLRPILERARDGALTVNLLVAAAVLVAVVAIRMIWVILSKVIVTVTRTWHRGKPPARSESALGGALGVSWAGMRGIVTLAAAFGLPETLPGGAAFPDRDLIILTAFVVVAGTLLLQGLTLRPLIARLRLEGEEPVGGEVRMARQEGYRAALAAIDGDDSLEARLVRREYAQLVHESQSSEEVTFSLPADPVRRRAIAAARRRLHALRQDQHIGDDAYHLLEEEFDRAELSAQSDLD